MITPVTAVFGGSFDPPHIGHAMVAQWVLMTGQADEVFFTPTFSHALKGRKLSPWEDRCNWVDKLAGAVDGRRCACCIIEDTLPQPSYTINTMEALEREFPGRTWRLIIGSDILSETHRWHRWDEIQARYNPIVANREGYKVPWQKPVFPRVSSTEIRRHLHRKEKDQLTTLVPKAVLDVLPVGALHWQRGK